MTPASTSRDRLGTLLESRHDLWRGRSQPDRPTLPTGHAGLDDWLPAGGWPCGCLIELVPQQAGVGELRLLLPLLADQTRQKRPVVLAAPPLLPCPQALQAAGIDLAHLIVVRRHDQALWAAEQCLKSGLCGAVLIWPPDRVQARAVRRLQLAAEHGPAPAFLYYRPNQPAPTSLATLRLAIRPGAEIELLRAPGQSGGRILQLKASNIVPLKPLTFTQYRAPEIQHPGPLAQPPAPQFSQT